ncbi:MAG TPA: hypothetical protein VGE83_11790, partial [Terracidiphilus sp.]
VIDEDDPQPTLFAMGRYCYRVWVTNLPLTPAGVWHFYDGRAALKCSPRMPPVCLPDLTHPKKQTYA